MWGRQAIFLISVIGSLGFFFGCGNDSLPLSSNDPNERGVDWRIVREPSFTAEQVAASPSTIVAFEPDAGVRVSTDGTHWTRVHLASRFQIRWNTLTCCNGKFLLYGGDYSHSTGTVVVSSDGLHWNAAESEFTGPVVAVAGNDTVMLAITVQGRVFRSTGGLVWHAWDSTSLPNWTSTLIWTGTEFLAYESGDVYASRTGQNWELVADETPIQSIGEIVVGNRKIAFADRYRSLWVSDDGRTWALVTELPSYYHFRGLAWSEEKGFVATGDLGHVVVSPDGETWELKALGDSVNLGNVTWWRDRYISANQSLQESFDGCAWQLIGETEQSPKLTDITYGNGTFVAVGPTAILISNDGETWQAVERDAGEPLNAVTWTGHRFIAVSSRDSYPGNGATLYWSSDGSTWSAEKLSDDGYLKVVRQAGGKLFAIGSRILVSEDHGQSWKQAQGPFSTYEFWNDIAFYNDRFVVVGGGGKMAYSSDGFTWANCSDGESENGNAVATYPEGFIQAHYDGAITYSSNGIDWQLATRFRGAGYAINDIIYDDKKFVVVGSWNVLIHSSDRAAWANTYPPLRDGYQSLASNGRQLVVVGANGSILVSP